jgi:hypothetical protein
MKRLASVLALSGIAAMAFALSSYSKVFNETYKVGKDSHLAKAACGVCHASPKGGKLNAYGVDVQAAMKAAGTKKMSGDILKKVEGMDSDKDGMKNVDEIGKDRAPGTAN